MRKFLDYFRSKAESDEDRKMLQELEEYLKQIEGQKQQTNIESLDDVKRIIAELTSENRQLIAENRKLLSELAELKKKEESIQAEMQKRAEQERKEKIDKMIEKLKKEGKIPAQNKELESYWRKQFELDFEAALKIAEALPVSTKPEGQKQEEGKTAVSNDLREQVRKIFEQQTNGVA